MSEQQRAGFANRKLWMGGGVAVLALGVALIAFDFPPKSADVAGTIAPAERYRAAPQSGAETVKLGDQTIAQLMQNDGFDRLAKDPQMKALAQNANMQAMASVLARMPSQVSQAILNNPQAAQAAAANPALASMVLQNAQASREVLASVQANQAVAAKFEQLASALKANPVAASQMLASIESAQAAQAFPKAAMMIAANPQLSAFLMSTNMSNSQLSGAQLERALQSAAANGAALQGAQAEMGAK